MTNSKVRRKPEQITQEWINCCKYEGVNPYGIFTIERYAKSGVSMYLKELPFGWSRNYFVHVKDTIEQTSDLFSNVE